MIKKVIILLSSFPAAIGIVLSVGSKMIIKEIDTMVIETILKYGSIGDNSNVESQIIYIAAKVDKYSFIIITISAVWLFIVAYLWEAAKEEVNDR